MSISSNRDKYFWFVSGERIGIVEKKLSTYSGSDPFQSPSSSGVTLRVFYTSKASHFTEDLKETSEIPSQFHEALCMKVISDLYKLPGDNFNLQLSQYYDGQYALQIREAKKYAKRNHISGGTIIPQDF